MLAGELDDDDDESYDSQIEGDVQTNFAGGNVERVALQGVKFFDEDALTNATRDNINSLLRNRRYHDDDVSEPIVRHAVGPRYAPQLPVRMA